MIQENKLYPLLRLVEETMYQGIGLDIGFFVLNRALESYSETWLHVIWLFSSLKSTVKERQALKKISNEGIPKYWGKS